MLTYRIPVQYIIGEWEFRNLTLTMRPPVFIPGPWTEVCDTTLKYPFSILHALEATEKAVVSFVSDSLLLQERIRTGG